MEERERRLRVWSGWKLGDDLREVGMRKGVGDESSDRNKKSSEYLGKYSSGGWLDRNPMGSYDSVITELLDCLL